MWTTSGQRGPGTGGSRDMQCADFNFFPLDLTIPLWRFDGVHISYYRMDRSLLAGTCRMSILSGRMNLSSRSDFPFSTLGCSQ